ncbi:MAG TPA: hypothetical protein VLL69_09495 [Streptosporangiaceae bacterium]|nr:hypothetical protein [Streptosporangiaceae bacterium]
MWLRGGATALIIAFASGVTLAACGGASPGATSASPGAGAVVAGAASSAVARAARSTSPAPSPSPSPSPSASPSPVRLPAAGNPAGQADVPPAGQPVSTSHPDHVIGDGTPASCTSQAVVAAVAAGGVITFSCGPRPVTITMDATAEVRNTSRRVVLDGGGMVALSGGGARRILYMNTCDQALGTASSDCFNQQWPRLIVQNMTFKDGNSTAQQTNDDFGGPSGGGAIFDLGGQLKVVDSRFIGNRCFPTGPDLGGAAIRALSQWENRPVYITSDTFRGGACSNGGALSSIGVSWVVLNSVMTRNQAIGSGANPARSGTPGGGSGGAIYTDGDQYTVTIAGTVIAHNQAREGGGAIFFVSNNKTGTLTIEDSALPDDPSDGFETAGFPGIFYIGQGRPVVTSSTLG